MPRLGLVHLAVLCASFGAASACGGDVGGAADASKPVDAGHAEASKGLDAQTKADTGGGDAATTAPLTLITEPDQGMSAIYALLRSAKHTIDMTLYELTDSTVTGILTTAVKNGLKVRVILDQNLEKMDNTPAYNALLAGNVQVHWANPVYAATHQKTITIDGTTSAIMSLNLSPDDYPTSRDFAVITTDSADVAAIETTFAADFVNAAITPPTGSDLVWSPTNAQPALLDIIGGAKSTLVIENEEMSYDTIVSALATAASHGVDVEVVMEASREWDPDFNTLVAAGVKVVTYEHAAIYIHAKVILADYGTSAAKVFIGSENFSHASITENRELGLITSDPGVMSSIHGTLAKDFSGGTPYVPVVDGGVDGGFDSGKDAGLDGRAEGGVLEGGGG
jgi:phosphatidylserine/phosphatidylglycerophosphate/cardiolipin synthase-like enzyme